MLEIDGVIQIHPLRHHVTVEGQRDTEECLTHVGSLPPQMYRRGRRRIDSPGRFFYDRRMTHAAVEALYRAEVTGFVVEASQPAPAAAEPASPPPVETPVSPGDDGGTGLVAPPAPVSDVQLDLKLTHQPGEELAGLTLEVGLLDPAGTEKEHYRIWVDASGLTTGEKRLSYRLEDVPYVEGDRFVASVRTPVPAAERGLYKEFPVAS